MSARSNETCECGAAFGGATQLYVSHPKRRDRYGSAGYVRLSDRNSASKCECQNRATRQRVWCNSASVRESSDVNDGERLCINRIITQKLLKNTKRTKRRQIMNVHSPSKAYTLLFFFLGMTIGKVCYAQSSISVWYSPSIPLLNETQVSLVDARVSYQYNFSQNIGINLSAGYYHFSQAGLNGNSYNLDMLPVLLGLNLSFGSDRTRFFFNFCSGYYFPMADLIKAGFGISPEIGIKQYLANISGSSKSLWLSFCIAVNATFSQWESKETGIGNGMTQSFQTEYVIPEMFVSFGCGVSIDL